MSARIMVIDFSWYFDVGSGWVDRKMRRKVLKKSFVYERGDRTTAESAFFISFHFHHTTQMHRHKMMYAASVVIRDQRIKQIFPGSFASESGTSHKPRITRNYQSSDIMLVSAFRSLILWRRSPNCGCLLEMKHLPLAYQRISDFRLVI
jgi:hypothetical protein